jgi:hypothetical protein
MIQFLQSCKQVLPTSGPNVGMQWRSSGDVVRGGAGAGRSSQGGWRTRRFQPP